MNELLISIKDVFGKLEYWPPDSLGDGHWRAYFNGGWYEENEEECPIVECCGYEVGGTPSEAVEELARRLKEYK